MEKVVATITIVGFIIGILIQVGTVGVFIGIYKSTIAFMQKQIEELKQDMKRYNSILSRIAIAENSISTCHKRIDTIENRIN